jgi:eukaryotic-like serine/threonine-protein kinase
VTTREVWGGKYAVFDEIASGGMASVYLACRLGPGDAPRVVAVKKLFEPYAKQPAFVTMFLDEAHLAARIRHPNVITTHEFLRVPGSLALVMEFILGVSLNDVFAVAASQGRPAAPGVASAIVRDILHGLHAAHETKDDAGAPLGLVHRDVSPHNAILGVDGSARLIDFGIAKAAGRLQVTDVGTMKGKYAYMAPEQIRAGSVDRRTDVYASGIVLWEALTGRELFPVSENLALFGHRGEGKVRARPPSGDNPALSPAIDALVMRALEFSPDARFPTALEMAEALEAALPAAPAGDVAAWVNRLVGSRIRELEAKRNEVETAFAAGELSHLISGTLASSGTPPSRSSLPDLVIPDLVAPPASRRDPLATQATVPAAPVSSARALGDPFDDEPSQDLKLDLDDRGPHPSRASFPSIITRVQPDITPPLRTRHRETQQPVARKVLVLAAMGVLVVVGITAGRVAPALAHRAILDGAARRGIVLAFDGAETRGGGIALSGVTATLEGDSDVTLKAPEVDLTLAWQGNLEKVTVPGFELALTSPMSDVGGHFAAWRAKPRPSIALDAKAGHLVWADSLAPNVRVEAVDVSLAVGVDTEGTLRADTPSLSVALPRGTLGPWAAHLSVVGEESKLVLALDRQKADGPPEVTFVARPALGKLLSATIPRGKLADLGVPAELLRAGEDGEIELGFEAQVMPSGEPVTAHATLTLFGAAPAPGAGAMLGDIVLDGTVGGDSARPLRIDPGVLTVGKVKSKLTGDAMIEHDGVRIEVDRPAPKTGALPPPFVFDTREWTSTAKPVESEPVQAPPKAVHPRGPTRSPSVRR